MPAYSAVKLLESTVTSPMVSSEGWLEVGSPKTPPLSAAYMSMAREDRADLHERFADWLKDGSQDRSPELDEILRYHLEQADTHRRATGTAY